MERHVISHEGQPVGIAVPESGRLKFIAVKYNAMEIDQRLFDSLVDIRKALKYNNVSQPAAA